jgi:hypothetical protein
MHTQIKRTVVSFILGMWLVLIGLATPAGAAITTNVFDNFDSYAVGSLPSPWQIGGGVDVVTNNLASSSPNSAFFNSSANVVVDFASGTERWFQADVHVVSNTLSGLSYIKLMDSSLGIAPFQVLLSSPGNGTYNVQLLSGRSLGTQTTYTNLMEVGSAFHTITFGAKITNAVTGDGLFSLYINGNAVVTNLAYLAYSTPALQMNRFALVNAGSQEVYLDNFGVFDVNPIPEPTVLVLGIVGVMVLWRRSMRRG